jgi:hypothetical protein
MSVTLLRAHVENGRIVVDDPTGLPHGMELCVVPIVGDDLDAEERAELHAAIEEGIADVEAGRVVDADEVIAELLAHSRRETPK